MSSAESAVQPRSSRQTLPSIADPTLLALRDLLFDLFLWFRGDMRIGRTTATILTASTNSVLPVGPPDASEEWEVLAMMVEDTAKIDVNDSVDFYYQDLITNLYILLQTSVMQVSNSDAIQIATFPNRDTTKSIADFAQSEFYSGMILKRRDTATDWMRIFIKYKTTATVGSRSVNVTWVYRRRRLI